MRYQACDARTCLLPRKEEFTLELSLDVVDVPRIPMQMGQGQREADFDSSPYLRRLLRRKIRQSPLGFLRYLMKHARLERAARQRTLAIANR